MSGFRADRRRWSAALGLFAAAAWLATQAPAVAQSRGPVSLIPPPAGGEASTPESPRRDPASPEILRSIPGTDDSSVRIRGLGAVDTEAVGLAGQDTGGLSADMWRGSSRALAERLISALPERLASPAAHDLARRLLLIAAEPPASARGDISLVKLRVEKLIALGAAEDAESLLRAVSARSLPENLVETAVRTRLLTSDFAGACQAMEASDTGFVSEFGQKALVFCQLMKQEFSEAVLGLELLREQNLAQDTVFFELSNAVISGAAPTADQLAAPGQASALNLALISLTGGQVPDWFADAHDPSVLKAVATTANADRDIRLAAARRAAQWGALSPAELAEVYAGLDIGADEVATILLEPDSVPAALRLAAMYRAVSGQDIAVARAEVLRETWRLAAEQQDWRLAVRLMAPQLRQVQPAPAFSWFAGDAMAASLAAGDVAQALDWMQIASSRGAADPAAADAVTAMWPALRMAAAGGAAARRDAVQAQVFDQSGRRSVATIPGATSLTTVQGDRVPWDERRLAEWITQREAGEAQDGASVAIVLALFDALGETVSDAAWVRADAAAPVAAALPPLDIWVGLQRAAAAGKVAETAFFALLAVGENEISQLHPATVHAVVGALQRAGLSRAARAIALEVAVVSAP